MNVEFRCRGRLIFETPAGHNSYFIPGAFIHEGVLYGVLHADHTGDTVVVDCCGPPLPNDSTPGGTVVGPDANVPEPTPAPAPLICGKRDCGKPATVKAWWKGRTYASCDDCKHELERYCKFEPIPPTIRVVYSPDYLFDGATPEPDDSHLVDPEQFM